MAEQFSATAVYCPDCDDNYELAWSEEKDGMYAVCGCDKAEPAPEFIDRFTDEYGEGGNDQHTRGFQ